MGSFSFIAQQPAFWGALGAFCYSGQRLQKCLTGPAHPAHTPLACIGEFITCLIVGAICAAAFSAIAGGRLGIKDINAIATGIGLLANVVVPNAPAMLGTWLESPLARGLKGKPNEP